MKRMLKLAKFIGVLSVCVTVQSGALHAESGLMRFGFNPGWQNADGSQIAAIEMDLAQSWYTYWRYAGDSGIPTEINWDQSENIASVEIIWPRPIVIVHDEYRSIGYIGYVTLPIEITPIDKNQPMHFVADVTMGVCEEICLLEERQINQMITQADNTRSPKIIAALLDQPQITTTNTPNCQMAVEDGQTIMDVTWQTPSLLGHEFLVVEPANSNLWVSHEKTTRNGETVGTKVEIAHFDDAPISIERSKLRSTLIGATQAITTLGCTQN